MESLDPHSFPPGSLDNRTAKNFSNRIIGTNLKYDSRHTNLQKPGEVKMYRTCWKCVAQIYSTLTSSSLTQVIICKHLNILITETITADTDDTSIMGESDNKDV